MTRVTSYMSRYIAGEHEAVWTEIRALGSVPDDRVDDVQAVADETMRRVARHVARIAEHLGSLGFVPADERIPVFEPPTDDDRAELDRLDEEMGGLPAAFAACLRQVGTVDFTGDCPQLGLAYHQRRGVSGMPPGPDFPDPLVVPSTEFLSYRWDDREDDEGFIFPFAPDELQKANISGGTHDLELPDAADPVLVGVVGRPGITLVQYLRTSIRWGGFPGWEFAADQAPPGLQALRVMPDF
jgi:hypothetical protein